MQRPLFWWLASAGTALTSRPWVKWNETNFWKKAKLTKGGPESPNKKEENGIRVSPFSGPAWSEKRCSVWLFLMRRCHKQHSSACFLPESSEEGSLLTPISIQPSPDSSDRASVASQPESSPPQDYLFLSQCKTGSVSINGLVQSTKVEKTALVYRHYPHPCVHSDCRCDSFSNSDISLEQKSLDDTIRDLWTESSSSSISHLSQSPCGHRRVPNSPFSAPCSFSVLPSPTSSPLRPCITDVFQFDRPFSSTSFEAAGDLQTPPPLPPKPCHLSEQQSDGGAPRLRTTSLQQFPGNIPLFCRRTSLSSLDHLRMGNPSI